MLPVRRALLSLVTIASVAAGGLVAPSHASATVVAPTASWTQQSPVTSPPVRDGASMAYNPSTGQTVLFGGAGSDGTYTAQTWTYDGTTWTLRSPTVSPPARTDAQFAYYPPSGKLVLFGGTGSSYNILGDTWTWDGNDWTQQLADNSAVARSVAVMDYYPPTGNLVLYGGMDSGGNVTSTTLIYNGSGWTSQSTTATVGLRQYAQMAYSPAIGRMVLYGGAAAYTPNAQTWAYDGTTWTQLSPTASPSATMYGGMAFDAALGRIVMYGGYDATGNLTGATWAYDGGTWAQLSPTAGPSARSRPALTYNESTGQLVLFGGASNGGRQSDTWTFGYPPAPATASTWDQQTPTTSPPARNYSAVAYSPATRQVLLFGGQDGNSVQLGDTWTYDGSTWTQRSPNPSPPARLSASIAYDPSTGKVLLFGGVGVGTNNRLSDTWVWDGTAWSQLSPAASPPARNGASLAYDPATRQMVLFGGFGTSYRNDTWLWTGTTWVQQSPGSSPSARLFAAMAYDSASRKLVLFSGLSSQSDTWAWDGTTWAQLSPGTSPSGRYGSAIGTDPATGRIILFGGFDGDYRSDSWTWTGSTWVQLSTAASPGARYGAVLTPNPATGQLLLFGGASSTQAWNDTWSYQPAVAAPGRPGAPVAVAGNAQAVVTVTAPGSGVPPTSYTVTAIDSTAVGRGGQTCTVTGASGSCTLSGLTNGDSYTFTSNRDGYGGTSAASAASNPVVPRAVLPRPVALPLSSSGTGTQSVTLSVPAGGRATLVDGTSPVEVAVVGQGTYTLAQTVLTFTPVEGFIGTPAPVTYQLTDGFGRSSRSTYQPVVTGTTGAQPVSQRGEKGEPQTFTPLAGFRPPAGQELLAGSLRITDPVSGAERLKLVSGSGTWQVNATTGAITFAPAPSFVGVATITFTVRTTGQSIGGQSIGGQSIASSADADVYTSTVTATVTGTVKRSARATIRFGTGSAKLTTAAARTIGTLVAKAADPATGRVATVGYPHPAGSSAAHRTLSRARAKATTKAVTARLNPVKVVLKSRGTRRGDGPAARSVIITITWTLTQR